MNCSNLDQKSRFLSALDKIGSPYRLPRLKRLIKKPILLPKMIISGFLRRVLSKKFAIKIKTKTFFKENMYITIPFYNDVWYYGAYVSEDSEVRLTRFFVKNLNDGNIFFDLGAHYGYYSLLASKLVGCNGKAFAFEPDLGSMEILKKNLRKNIKIINNAISDVNGEISFYSMNNFTEKTGSTINTECVGESTLNFKEVKVNSQTLDSFCQENNTFPDFIKIDVEGSEEKILRGAENLLKNHNPIIAMEVWFDPFTDNYRKAINILKTYSFRIFAIKDNGDIEEIIVLERYFELLKEKHRKINYRTIFDNLIFKK